MQTARIYIMGLVLGLAVLWGGGSTPAQASFEDVQLQFAARQADWGPVDTVYSYGIRMTGNPGDRLPLSLVVEFGGGYGEGEGVETFHGEQLGGDIEYRDFYLGLGLRHTFNKSGRLHPSLEAGAMGVDMGLVRRNHPKVGDGNPVFSMTSPHDQIEGRGVGGWAQVALFWRSQPFDYGTRPWFELGAMVRYQYVPIRTEDGQRRNSSGLGAGLVVGVSGF